MERILHKPYISTVSSSCQNVATGGQPKTHVGANAARPCSRRPWAPSTRWSSRGMWALNPSIPTGGEHGIEVHDELEIEFLL